MQEALTMLHTEQAVCPSSFEELLRLLNYLNNNELLALQEQYVTLFDRTPALSLHLFEHVYGDSRDRGQAMVDLADLYKQQGLVITNGELPDYLPLFLEYLSCLDLETALKLLAEPITIIAVLADRLHARDSLYAAVFAVLLEMVNVKLDQKQLGKMRAKLTTVNNEDDIDQNWQEPKAFGKFIDGA